MRFGSEIRAALEALNTRGAAPQHRGERAENNAIWLGLGSPTALLAVGDSFFAANRVMSFGALA